MRKIQRYIIIIIICGLSITLFLNKSNIKKELPGSIGDPLELVLVKSQEDFSSDFFTTFKELLTVSIGPAPQTESMLNVIEIEKNAFKGIFQRHQNILIISKADKFTIKIKYNLFANNQLIVFIECPSLTILKEKKEEIINIVYKIKTVEIKRLSEKFQNYSNIDLQKKIEKQYGVLLTVPKEFFLAHNDSNIVWARRETQKISQGIFMSILSNPVQEANQNEKILEIMDSTIQLHILGPKDHSHMMLEKNAPIKIDSIIIDDIVCVKTQSLWRMKNDFMGGICNVYYFNSKKLTSPLLIYTYLYGPGEEKKIPLLQLEAIINTFKIKKV